MLNLDEIIIIKSFPSYVVHQGIILRLQQMSSVKQVNGTGEPLWSNEENIALLEHIY